MTLPAPTTPRTRSTRNLHLTIGKRRTPLDDAAAPPIVDGRTFDTEHAQRLDRYSSNIEACKATLAFYSTVSDRLKNISCADAVPCSSEEPTPEEPVLVQPSPMKQLSPRDIEATSESSTTCTISTNLYTVLGLDSRATLADITRAYRRLARTWHPDRRPDKDDDGTFKLITEAHAILSNQERRSFYDRTGFKCEADLMTHRGLRSPQHNRAEAFMSPTAAFNGHSSPMTSPFGHLPPWMHCGPPFGRGMGCSQWVSYMHTVSR